MKIILAKFIYGGLVMIHQFAKFSFPPKFIVIRYIIYNTTLYGPTKIDHVSANYIVIFSLISSAVIVVLFFCKLL